MIAFDIFSSFFFSLCVFIPLISPHGVAVITGAWDWPLIFVVLMFVRDAVSSGRNLWAIHFVVLLNFINVVDWSEASVGSQRVLVLGCALSSLLKLEPRENSTPLSPYILNSDTSVVR